MEIVFIADSHGVGSFGQSVDSALRGVSDPAPFVRSYASCGSSATGWVKGFATRCGYSELIGVGDSIQRRRLTKASTPLLARLLAQWRSPTSRHVTIVALGSNSIGSFAFGEEAARKHVWDETVALAGLLRKSGSECIWIGPPHMRKFDGMRLDSYYKTLEVALKPPGRMPLCELIDSREYTKYPASGGDGVHYSFRGGKASAEKWAEGVMSEIRPLLAGGGES